MTATTQSPPLLEKIASTIGDLPASPAIVSAVMGLTADLNSSVEDLGEVLAADPGLTAKVLKLSNSSFYGRSRSVSSLKEAILILGFYTLRSIVIASSTHALYYRNDNAIFGQKMWDHSLACALASRIVARRLRHPRMEEIFLVGLLHDIGKIILGQKLQGAYDKIVAAVELDSAEFCDAEQAQLGFTHVDIGALVLERWHFPVEIVDGVRQHHFTRFPQADGAPAIAAVVGFSNGLAKSLGVGFGASPTNQTSITELSRTLALGEADVAELLTELQTCFSEERKLFEEN